jgi:carbon-monoxide dehydrogenase medium subunit
MQPMEILEPRSVDEAVAALAQHGDEARLIAGGTAVVLMLQNRLISPAYLINLGQLDPLRYIRYEQGIGLRLGALTTIREAELSPVVREHFPVLAKTFGEVANVRVRNAATVGGNMTEADYASDPPAVLVGLRARVRAVGPGGEREIPLTEFFKDFYETALGPDEVLTEIVVPEDSKRFKSTYIKYVTRSSEDRPCIGTAAFVDLDQAGTCRELRVVIGAIASTPQEIASAEGLAAGQRLDDELLRAVAEKYASEVEEPIEDLRGSSWYRREMVRVFVRRGIEQALNPQPLPPGGPGA